MFEGRLNVLTHQRNDDEDAEHAVDDAGDGSEKIDEKFERVRNSCGSQLCKKNGGADAEGHGDQQRYRRRDKRPVNEGQSAELFEDRVPDGRAEKVEPELVAGESGALPQFENEQHGDKNDGSGEQKGNHSRDFVAFAKAGKKRARARGGAPARNGGNRCCHVTGRYSGPSVPLRRLPSEASHRIGPPCSSVRLPASTSRSP